MRLNLAFQSQAMVRTTTNVRLKSGGPTSSIVGGPAYLRGKETAGGMFHLVSIVQAFQQARKRMVDARESLLIDLKTE